MHSKFKGIQSKDRCYIFIINLDVPINILQSVEEAECRTAYDSAAEVYMSAFDRLKPPEEVSDNAVFFVVLDFSYFLLIIYFVGCTKGSS